MIKLNPCVTGDTKVITTEGVKSFKELADSNDDVLVYCLNMNGEIIVSKMFHPRVTGYRMPITEITLDDGTKLKATQNHSFLTDSGYQMVDDLVEGVDIILSFPTPEGDEIPTCIEEFTECKGTKKGTVIKKCELTGEEFECPWEERETSTAPEAESDFYRNLKKIWGSIERNSSGDGDHLVTDIKVLDEPEDVYNGTVAVYHNYFTIDENTGTIVNQLNCGE